MNLKNVVIINDFNYVQGGASKVAIDTAKLLSDKNIKVYFFSAVNMEEEKLENITYISTNQNEALREKNKLKGIVNGIYNCKAKKELKKLLKMLDRNTTVIHIHGWTKALSSSVFDIAFKMKFKVVLTLHDYFIACPNGGYFDYKEKEICKKEAFSWKCIKCNCDSRNYIFKLYRLIRQFVQNKIVKLPRKIQYVIGISDLSINILKTSLNANVYIEKIYNPIEILTNKEKVDISQNEYYLYVGRIDKEKGVDIFCKVLTELNLKGIVVGDGSEKKSLENQYPYIRFVGWKNKKEIQNYMRFAKALIFPSLWYETAGLIIMEAYANGLPVFVSDNTAATEFIIDNSIFDFKFGCKNIEDLKNKIKIFESIEKSMLGKISQLCLEAYNNYSKNNYIENLINYFTNI